MCGVSLVASTDAASTHAGTTLRRAGSRAARAALLVYAGAAYALFLGVLLWAIAFLAAAVVARNVDNGTAAPVPVAVALDAALLLLFAVQHSVMARPAFKRAWTRIVPEAAERSTYVLFASAALVLVFWQWRPVTTRIWHLDGAAAAALWILYAAGWVVAVTSTWMVSHTDLFGLRQAYLRARDAAYSPIVFRERLLYRIVRHPLMLGLLIAFWATPRMSAGHLLFAVLGTGYILTGTRLEERDLRRSLGEVYARYAARVPALIPVFRRHG